MSLALPDPAAPDPFRGKYRNRYDEPMKAGTPQDLHDAWRILAGGAPQVATALVDIAANGAVESARVAAARTALAIVGFSSTDSVQVLPPEHDPALNTSTAGESPSQRIRNRLNAIAARDRQDAPDAVTLDDLAVDEPYVVDAEPEPPSDRLP